MQSVSAWLRHGAALAWVLGLGLGGGIAQAQPTTFPEGIGARLEAQPWWSHESNPFRFSEAQQAQAQDDTIVGALARGALAVPLLSERTRLDLSGTLGHARYQHYRQLNHDPARLDAVLRWHAGHALSGSVRYRYANGLYRYLNRSYPERDMVTDRLGQADFNVHVTPSLVLPRVTVWENRVGYEFDETSMLFTRRSRHIEVSAQWRGIENSRAIVGWQRARGTYTQRTPFWANLVGRDYQDDAWFADVQWDYSVKTTLAARVAYQKRQYTGVTGRDVNQWVVILRAGWDPSPKSRWDLSAWYRPFPNDEDPTILYGTLTGGRVSWRWHPTVKTMLSLAASYEEQVDTPIAGSTTRKSRLLRFGPRFEWQIHRRIRLFVDGWHDRTTGSTASNSYRNTVVRAGLVISLDNHWQPPPGMLWHSECDPPRYIEALACQFD